MGLLSFLHKNKQESVLDEREFHSRAEEESNAVRNRDRESPRKRASNVREDIDPVLPEKKRARRRLVGAFALILAAIVGVPMLLDSEPKPLAGDVAIQIPSRDKPIINNEHVAEIAAANAGSASATSSASASAATPSASANTPAITPTITSANKPSASSRAISNVATPTPTPVSTPTPTPRNVAVAQSLDATEEVVETKKPEKKPENKPRPTPTASPAATTTPKPQPTPKPIPVKPTVAEAPKETKPTPVHVDSEPKPTKPAKPAHVNNDDAERAKAILEGRANEEPAKVSKFLVQVAALATQEKVDELQAKLREAGLSSHAQKVTTASGERTRVRLGPFSDKQEAERAKAKLQALGLGGTLVAVP